MEIGRASASTGRSGRSRPGERAAGSCWLCRGSDLAILPFRYAFRGRHLYGVRCCGCGLVFVHPQPAREEIAAMYDEAYFTECGPERGAHGALPYLDRAEASRPKMLGAARRLEKLLKPSGGPRGRLLEIGCGPGYLLSALRELGWSVSGLEISGFAARRAREEFGLEIAQGPIAREAFPASSLDAVLMGDVLEHLADPLPSLGIVREWLAPGGRLVIALPSTMNLLSTKIGLAAHRILGRFRTLRIAPYHLFEYTPRTARAMLAASGFDLIDLRQSAVRLGRMPRGGSILERGAKLAAQLLAHATTRSLNRGGDRLLLVARKPPACPEGERRDGAAPMRASSGR